MTKPDQQGFLGHLEDKSKEELMDLLQRQEKLHQNQKFIRRLPDQGRKIQHMMCRLRELIAQGDSVDTTAGQFERMALGAERAQRQRTGQEEEEEEEEEEALLRCIVNRGTTGKVYANEAQSRDCTSLGDCGSETFVNAYDRVIRKVDASKTKPRYLPNRSIHASNVHELVDRIGSLQLISEGKPLTRATHSAQRPRDRGGANDTADTEAAHPQDVSPMSCHAPGTTTDTSHCPHDPQGGSTVHTPATGETSGLRHRYDDLLEGAMPRHTPRHECAKMLSLTDVLSLQREQQRTHAESEAKHAAERLSHTHTLLVGMSSFDPEGTSGGTLRYREIRDDVDTDSDDDLDAPD